jgi:hypothetical protein
MAGGRPVFFVAHHPSDAPFVRWLERRLMSVGVQVVTDVDDLLAGPRGAVVVRAVGVVRSQHAPEGVQVPAVVLSLVRPTERAQTSLGRS